ncbi:MAG: efflux RND transporter periplasmic adaptor subunit [Gammaproteobacteria bacterium]
MPPAVVAVAEVQEQGWQDQVHSTGTLTADQGIMVKAEVPGRVTRVYFKSGQNVKQGEPLVELDQSILRAQLQLYEAQLHLNELQYKRYSDLYKKHFVSTSDYDTAAANLQSTKAQVAQVQAQLAQMLIKAPFSGKLGLKQVDLGDYVTAGQILVNLQDTDPLRVDFSVPETSLSKVAIGDTVLIRTNSYPDQTFKGKVYAFEASIDPNTRTLAMRANIPNKDNKLIPGSFVDVTLLLGKTQKLWVIPQTALVSSLQGDFVYRAINGHAVKTPVVVQKRSAQQAVISSGLAAGDKVVTDGQLKIPFDGAPIMTGLPQPGAAKNAPTH